MRTGIAPEDQLCLLLVRGRFAESVRKQVLSLLATPIRWDLVLEQARRHQVIPLVYRNLRTLGFPGVPAQVRTELEGVYRMNALRNTLLAQELTQALQLLGDAGVPVIPLKGLPLAESLYGDRTLRICEDIDILVPQRTVAQAFDLLVARGYRAEFKDRFFADLLLRSDIEYTVERVEQDFRYVLELHWGLPWWARDSWGPKDLWAEVQPKAFCGVPAYALSPEWEFLFLAGHAARHQWRGLKWLTDIHELCCCGVIDWDKVNEKTRYLGWEEVVRLTLTASCALFETPLPPSFSPGALPPRLKLFPAGPSGSNALTDATFCIRLLQRPSEKLKYILRRLFVPTLAERRLLRLPFSLRLLYYLIRPLRVACKSTLLLFTVGFERRRLRLRLPSGPK